MLVSRRELLKTLAAAGIGLPLTRAQAESDVRRQIVERCRRLAQGKDVALHIMLPAGSEGNVRPVARSFTRETGVRFENDVVPVDDINARLILASSLNHRVDVALPATFGIPDLAEAGALRSLNGIPDGERPGDRSLFWLGDYYNDRLYGFQTDGDVYVMFYNRAILGDTSLAAEYRARFGVAPRPARTWAELDRMLEFYQRPEDGLYGGCLFRTPRYIAWEYWIRLHAKGLTPFDADMRPQIDTAMGVEAADELAQATRHLTRNARAASLFENWSTFAEGNVLCNIGWGGSQKYFQANPTKLPEGVLVAPTPSGDKDEAGEAFAYFNWGWNYAVPRTSAHPEIAALFGRYAVLPTLSAEAVSAADGFFDPFHQAHYEDQRIADIYDAHFLDVHRHSMQVAIPDLYLRGQSQYFSVLSDYLLQVDRGDSTPGAALGAVAKQWEGLTNRLGRQEQIRQWRLLLDRYPMHLRPDAIKGS